MTEAVDQSLAELPIAPGMSLLPISNVTDALQMASLYLCPVLAILGKFDDADADTLYGAFVLTRIAKGLIDDASLVSTKEARHG